MFNQHQQEKILFISKIIRVCGVLLFVGKMINTLKTKPKLLRAADYFVGLSSTCLLMISVFSLFNYNDNTLMDVEVQLLFPIAMIFGIEYKSLPSILGFIRPRKKFDMLSFLFLTAAFALGIATELGISDETALPILFNIFVILSSITFGFFVYVYNNYENKKHILQSTKTKRSGSSTQCTIPGFLFVFCMWGLFWGCCFMGLTKSLCSMIYPSI